MSRIKKVAQQLKREISQIILLELRDPRIGFLTITQVKVSPDLKFARVYYTLLGNEKSRQRAEEGLRRASGYIRKRIAQRIELKFVPEVEFYFDQELDRSLKIEKLLDELRDERNKKNQGRDS